MVASETGLILKCLLTKRLNYVYSDPILFTFLRWYLGEKKVISPEAVEGKFAALILQVLCSNTFLQRSFKLLVWFCSEGPVCPGGGCRSWLPSGISFSKRRKQPSECLGVQRVPVAQGVPPCVFHPSQKAIVGALRKTGRSFTAAPWKELEVRCEITAAVCTSSFRAPWWWSGNKIPVPDLGAARAVRPAEESPPDFPSDFPTFSWDGGGLGTSLPGNCCWRCRSRRDRGCSGTGGERLALGLGWTWSSSPCSELGDFQMGDLFLSWIFRQR